MRRTRRPATGTALLLVAVLALAACNPRLIGSPEQAQVVEARFDTVRNLVVGHAVRLADVEVGRVTDIALDGFEARVRMAVEPDVRLVEGTVASIGRTSLLGEHYVALTPPRGADVADLPALATPAEVPTAAGPPELEDVVERSLALVGAIATDDVDTILQRTQEVVDGREDQIVALVDDLARVTDHYASRRDQLGRVIDGLARTGAGLADNAPAAGALVDDVDRAVAVLARQRDRIVDGLTSLRRLAAAAEGSMLGDTRAEFEATLAELGPVVATLAEDTDRVDELITQVLDFVARIQDTVRDDEIELYGLMTIIVPEASSGDRAVRDVLGPTP